MKTIALILAAHGSRTDPGVHEQIRALAGAVAARGVFAEVSPAFNHGAPGFAEALDRVAAPRVVVVPVMAAEGYFCDVVLPGALRASPRFDALDVRITPPVGVAPGMGDLVVGRARELLARYRLRPASTTLILVGHGTPRHPRSSTSTHALVERLRAERLCAEVLPAFLDEVPSISETLDTATHRELLVIPFLISNGPHATHDVPNALGLALGDHEAPPVARAAAGGRWIVCDRAIGADPAIVDLVLTAAGHFDTSTFRLGTRSSRMAMWQAELVARLLRARGAHVEIVPLDTTGDRDRSRAIADLPSTAPFADDLEAALLRGEIDLAVHCLKDMPAQPTPGLTMPAVLPRQDIREALVARDGLRLVDLPHGAVVGTSSPRRSAQLLRLRPDLRLRTIRGPVEDRVRQVREGQFDAALLALAGLERLGLAHEASEVFPAAAFLPAPGQGALVVQTREGDARTIELAAPLDDAPSRRATAAEWALQAAFDEAKDITVAAWAECHDDALTLHARLLTLDGLRHWSAEAIATDPEQAAIEARAVLDAARCRPVEEPV